MAFKKAEEYIKEKQGGFFGLRGDGEYADVIFMYKSKSDMVVCDTHYVKSDDYSGYVHCNGGGCAACGKNIRLNQSLFIPVYNIQAGEIQFIDKGIKWEQIIQNSVFKNYPDPSGYVFRITRKDTPPAQPGQYNVVRYEIVAMYQNNVKKIEELIPVNDPYVVYGDICKQVDNIQLNQWLTAKAAPAAEYPQEYIATPRVPVLPDMTEDVVPEVLSPDAPVDF